VPDVESVIESHERYAVVEKKPDATEIVERTDPRQG
jgi:hypothetical protein